MESLMDPSFILIFLGMALSLIGSIWFRHPGQSFWFCAPVWEASKYLNKTGVRLWVIGFFVSMFAILWAVWYAHFSG